MKAGKFIIGLFWLGSIRNLFIPFAQPLYSVLLWLLPLVLLVHGLEQWFFGRRFQALGSPLSVKDRLLIIVFGGFHLMTLMKRLPDVAVSDE
ncbi:DUF1145 domain-containing protein [Endozoicomonas montiporae]|uniref:Putative membrane protein n=1 Tax=Endozoicomonas montiporae CL-33 TaxID=570277 RepID=A0A142BDU9_9GAMM|nr:DUF1145 domain-containing protein [Endozoicomonas montiporae]AMO56925.1 putative membrane protein [Endozoicomonas montiporae CL-33]